MTRFIVALCLLSSSIVAPLFAQQTNYAGKWKINLAKSEFGTINPNVACKEFDINQSADSVTIKRISEGENQDIINIENILGDGKFRDYEIDNGKKRVHGIWSADRKTLTRIGDYDLNYGTEQKQYSVTEILILSPDGKTLSDNLTVEHRTGKKYSIKAVYDRSEN